MEYGLTVRAARAIMGEQLFMSDEDVPVLFERADLYRLRETGRYLFHIPPGSLGNFPQELTPVHHEGDVVYERAERWVDVPSGGVFVVATPGLLPHLSGMPLTAQKERLMPLEVLSPYEIACMASYWVMAGKGKFFSGEARTEQYLGMSINHVHAYPLTIIMSYDGEGRLRLGRGYESQMSPTLGIIAGKRYRCVR